MIRRASATTSRASATIRPFSHPIVIPSRPSGRTALRTTRSSMSPTADQLADALRTQRHLAHAHAERHERVLDRLGHERLHGDRAGLAHALDAERIEWRVGLDVHD